MPSRSGRTVLVLLTPEQHQALRAVQAGPAPQGGTVSPGRYLAALLDAELQRLAAERAQRANAAAAQVASLYEQGRAPARAVGESEVLTALAGATDPRVRERLKTVLVQVGQWSKQIRALAIRWRCAGVEQGEFESAGMQGLLEAADRFDGRPSGWPTYATLWIRRRIQELARAQGGPIVMATHCEERRARRAGESRRAAGWAPLDHQAAAPHEEDDPKRHARVVAAMKRLPRELRAALAPETRGKRKAAPALRERALEALRALLV